MIDAKDSLLSVPGAQLHKVENNLQTLLIEGDFTVAIVGTVPAQEQRVEAAVGDVTWPLGKHLPALKAAQNIYSFALEHTRAVYYCLILPADTSEDVLEAVYDVLYSSCALSTVKQVDAAAEEVDKLQGGKEAAALQAAAAAGLGPEAAGAAAAAVAAEASTASIQAGKYELKKSGNAAADSVAAGLLWGGTMMATVVGKAATATAGAIQSYTQKQLDKQQPNHKPATVSPTFRRGLAAAATIASGAAYVTGRLADLVGQASYSTALMIAKALPGHKKQKKSGELATPEERSALHTMGAAGLVAFVDVYDSLEAAAKVVFAQSADATTQYITYKYGPEAGVAAADSVPVARDMLSATMNFSRLGARAFISGTAKRTAKVYLKSAVAGLHPNDQAAGSRLPSFNSAQPPVVAAGAGQSQQFGLSQTNSAPAALQAGPAGGRLPSSSNLAPYPHGPAAAAAQAAANEAWVQGKW